MGPASLFGVDEICLIVPFQKVSGSRERADKIDDEVKEHGKNVYDNMELSEQEDDIKKPARRDTKQKGSAEILPVIRKGSAEKPAAGSAEKKSADKVVEKKAKMVPIVKAPEHRDTLDEYIDIVGKSAEK
ncbi:unnamed protein product [Heligmosomoides polygyrus]|uniref:Uncharacterized protein n=1 Tax=Heligmosomoides polygyrus TaxID=6339 RepID=A0A183FMY9_HELPZ|nr:unnamed protein product [Heligmosomoides polygyrus]